MSNKKWNFTAHDQSAIESLMKQTGVSPVVAQLLFNRGIVETDDIRRFLEAKLSDLRSPEDLPGLSGAADRIMDAIRNGEQIVVYGDYDADGMTATSILYRCLKSIDANVSYHLPNRMEEGYGLHVDSVEKLAKRGKHLLITVDCGVASIEPAKRARELGLSLIITDHHRFGDELPVADAIVHPALPGSSYPFAGLCGAGVAFKLAWALCQRHCGSPKVTDRLRNFLLQAIGLAAIGTVADVVPLVDENRVIVRHGLKTLHQKPTVGMQELMAITKLDSKEGLSAEDIAFMLAPRLNAAGRLGQAQLGVELLVTDDPERAKSLANYIDELNANRNKLERSIQLSASKQLKEVHDIQSDPAFVLASPAWHPGVIGIVAGKLAEKFYRPVVMVALDKLGAKPGTGSGRSPNGVNLHAAFQECSDLLISGGGHAAAAGMKINESNLSAFRAAFLESVAEQSSELDREAEIQFDAEATLGQLDLNTVTQVEKLAPFGMGNPRPIFCTLKVDLAEPPRVMGSAGRHLSLQVTQHGRRVRAVAFGQAEDWMPDLESIAGPIDLAYRPVINEFRGFRKVELQLVDWRPHASPSPQVSGPHFAADESHASDSAKPLTT